MMMRNSKKKMGSNLFILLGNFITIVCIVSMSGYVLSTTDYNFSIYILIITFIYLLTRFKYKKTFVKSNTSLLFWFLFITFSLISTLFNFSMTNLNASIVMILLITVAFLISETFNFESFINVYNNVLKILTIIALFAHFVVIIMGNTLNLAIIKNINGAEYLNGYLFFIRLHGSTISERSMSIFWEPGLYASFLIIALIFEVCFMKEKSKVFNIIIFTLGLLISQSTAGYLLLALIFALAFFKRVKNGYIFPFFVFIIIIVLIYLNLGSIIEYLVLMDYDTFHKLESDELLNSTRFNAGLLNLYIFSRAPIFGNGFAEANNIYTSLMFSWNVLAQTSTPTYFLAAIGVPGLIYSITWIYSVLRLYELNYYSRIIILVIVFIILNKEPHEAILFSYCLLFYFIKRPSKINKYI